jgi:hypothetical protein
MRNLIKIGFCLWFFFAIGAKAESLPAGNDKGMMATTKVYPNPISNGENLTIEGNKEIQRVEIINIVGKEVILEKVLPANRIELNINGLDKGVYFIKVYFTDNNSIIERIWVK